MMFDVAVIGAGIAGMSTAARLQAHGLKTLVIEAHTHIGGCAGYFRRRGFSFDVGATTLVDFEPGGVGGELLTSIGMDALEGEALPGYVAWLPDRTVTLHRDRAAWAAERLRAFGDTPAHRRLWALLDQIADVFWKAARRGIKLPMQSPADLLHNIRAVGSDGLPLARHLYRTMGDALRAFHLDGDRPLAGLLSMLIEDTVHSTVEDAPLINAALGITIRGAGLTRNRGGMRGFWERFGGHYRAMGGSLQIGCQVERIEGQAGKFTLHTRRGGEAGSLQAAQIVSAIPAQTTAQIAPPAVGEALAPFLKRDSDQLGGAVVVFLGVPEDEVTDQTFTHHQLLQDYAAPLGNGNNMFISVSAADDLSSAPAGNRAVMISTHCALADWECISASEYETAKRALGDCLIAYARRVYPRLGERKLVYEIGTPQTYGRFAHRPRGAVGGAHLTLRNANQHAIPHQVGIDGFWLAGDSTFPGLGTVACVLGSRIVAEGIMGKAGDDL